MRIRGISVTDGAAGAEYWIKTPCTKKDCERCQTVRTID